MINRKSGAAVMVSGLFLTACGSKSKESVLANSDVAVRSSTTVCWFESSSVTPSRRLVIEAGKNLIRQQEKLDAQSDWIDDQKLKILAMDVKLVEKGAFSRLHQETYSVEGDRVLSVNYPQFNPRGSGKWSPKDTDGSVNLDYCRKVDNLSQAVYLKSGFAESAEMQMKSIESTVVKDIKITKGPAGADPNKIDYVIEMQAEQGANPCMAEGRIVEIQSEKINNQFIVSAKSKLPAGRNGICPSTYVPVFTPVKVTVNGLRSEISNVMILNVGERGSYESFTP